MVCVKNMNHIDLLKDVIVHEEISDTHQEVSFQDVIAYSQRLGIDLVQNPGLSTLIKDWILQPLPRYWFPCLDTRSGHWFYSNALNGQSTWDHPLEEIHRALAKEYCDPQIKNTFERENPEGESAEQSMEFGLGVKDPTSGESPSVGSGSRGLLPRLLAPLKRPAKPETPSFSSKPLLSPIVSHGSSSEKILESEFSSNALSTFKPSNPIRSLLPNDILFDNKSRPASAAPINGKLIPPIAAPGVSRESAKVPGIDSSNDAKKHPADKDKSNFLLAYEQSETPSENPVIKDTSTENVPLTNSRVTATKPASGLSFTERLAAKKASRSKLGTEAEKIVTKPNLSIAENRPSSEKKRVQFDLEKEQVMHYTPENSEENKISDKSESSSSDDLFDLLGDPKDLKPLKDTADFASTFEEKRWDVKLTSFGVSSSQESSPVKAPSSQTEHGIQIKDIGDDEMVTAFTSEYCPSPLPAKSETREDTHSTQSAAMFIEESISSIEDAKPCQESTSLHEPVLELDILTNIPAPIITSEEPMDLKPLSQTLPDISSSTTTLTDVPIIKALEETPPVKLETKSSFIDSIYSSNASKDTVTFIPKVEEAKKPSVSYAIQSSETESVHSAPSLMRKKLARSISRCDSFENSIASVHSDSVILPNPVASSPLSCSIEPTNHDSTDKPSNLVECHKIAQLVSSQPSPILASDSSSSSLITQSASTPADGRKISLEGKEAPVAEEKAALTPAPVAPPEEWLRMKQEMESVLESEKARMENWFKEEIAQIKCQFEKELASERERTECLSKLVESAQNEKEEAAKLELTRMQETLAKLVEEKTREVQTRWNNEILQTASVQKAPVCRTDANVQTDERKPPVEKSTSTEPLKLTPDAVPNPKASHSHRETQVSPLPRQDSWIKCQCDNLQKQVARVEREMQLLKQKNLSFQKSTPMRKKSTPVKAQRESWWVDSDDSTASSSSCSYAKLRPLRHRRSRSLSNLHGERPSHSSRKSKTSERSRDFPSRSQSRRRSQWLDDTSPDQSTETLTSGVSSTLSAAGEWDTVLSSLHKITDDIHEAWSQIGGRRQRPLSCLPSQRFTDSLMWTSTSTPIYQGNRVPLHWSLSGSTAERTQALKLWLQQNNSHHSHLLCKSDQL